jgi:hypothetical protein
MSISPESLCIRRRDRQAGPEKISGPIPWLEGRYNETRLDPESNTTQ